jgi:hypothetical protein
MPLLVFHIVKHETVGGRGDRGDVASIGRPARAEESLRARQQRDIASLEVKQLDKYMLGHDVPKGETGAIGRPRRVGLLHVIGSQSLWAASVS